MAEIITITDFQAPELDIYARCSETQLLHYYEPKGGIFIAESPKVIERALNMGCEPISILTETKHIDTQLSGILSRFPELPVYTAPYEVLTQLTGFALTRGALCAMHRPALKSVGELCRDARRIAVLENVVNPTNVGAIIRSAAALHMDAVLLTPACSDPFYRRAARVSMGTVFQIPWTYLSSGPSADVPPGKDASYHGSYVEQLKNLGFLTVAMALRDQSLSITDPALANAKKLAIILGTEGEGLAQETIGACDHTVMIPMSHGVDSLNVAAASAVAFFEITKDIT